MLVLDAATNAPLANFPLELSTGECGIAFESKRTTDVAGKLQLRLPAIAPRFASKRDAADQVTPSEVDWVLDQDPLVLRVTLAP